MVFFFNFFILNTWNFLSWEKCYKNIYRIQTRVLKAILVCGLIDANVNCIMRESYLVEFKNRIVLIVNSRQVL